MDIYEIRRNNLHRLLAQHEGPTALSKKLNHKGTSYISQLSVGRRPITERTARDIEHQLRMPKGWFDVDGAVGKPATVPPSPMDMRQLADAVKRVAEAAERQRRKLAPTKFAEVTTFVCQEAMKGRAVDVDAVLQLVAD